MLEHISLYLLSVFVVGLAVGIFAYWKGRFDEREVQANRLGGFAGDVHTRIYTGRWPQ